MGWNKTLFKDIRRLLARDQAVVFQCTLREGTTCADWLAIFALTIPASYRTLVSYPRGLNLNLFGDIVGGESILVSLTIFNTIW